MADFCDRNGNFVSGLRAPKRVFKMESITDEQDCVCVIESVSGSPYVEDHPKITVTLRSSTSEISSAEINSTRATSGEYKLDTAFQPENVTLSQRNKSLSSVSALTQKAMNTFSLGSVHEHLSIETACENKGVNRRLQNNSFSSSTGNNLNDAFTLKAQPAVNDCDLLNAAFPIDRCDNLRKKLASFPTYNKDHGQAEVRPGCNQRETEYHPSQTELPNDLTNVCYENTEGDTCFATEIRMICKNQDVFSESAEHVIASGNECFSDHAYHNTTIESGRQSTSSDYFNCDLKGDNTPVYQDADEEFHNESYENIELSSIFSSSDIYQRSFDQDYAANSLSPSQENSDSSSNFITDLDNRSCEKFMADSGIFGLSLSDSGCEFFQSDGMHDPQMISSAQFDISGDTLEPDKDCDLMFKTQERFSTSVANSTHTNTALFSTSVANSTHTSAALFSTRVTNSIHTNAALFPDPGTRMPDNVQTGCHVHHKSTATSTFSSGGLSFCCNAFDKSPSVPSFYDPCLSDYHRYIYHSPYSQATASTEWKSWTKGSCTAYNSPGSLITSKKPTDDSCPVSSTDIRGSDTKPEIVQFIEINAKEDEEETDDADEIDYLPVCFNTNDDQCASHMDPHSVGTSEYHGENLNADYSPSVLTPPPSASSTPVPSTTQESISNEIDLPLSLPMSHYNTTQAYSSPTGPAFACKLNHEQLEASLLSFGLSQGAKRPYPSMADAMRSSRSKSATRKKYSQEGSDKQPRRSGRPRKTQIQSDTISTTAVSNKQRKRMVSKPKCEPPEQDVKNVMKSSEDQAGSSKISGTSRHNEPLKQNAIGIMSQWFEDHIDNPYPSKADKEKMAIQGGITENQVKSWFANKRNRTNNTKPKVQKRAMEEKLKEIFRDLKRNHHNPMADNSHVIQQLSGIIQHCHTTKLT